MAIALVLPAVADKVPWTSASIARERRPVVGAARRWRTVTSLSTEGEWLQPFQSSADFRLHLRLPPELHLILLLQELVQAI